MCFNHIRNLCKESQGLLSAGILGWDVRWFSTWTFIWVSCWRYKSSCASVNVLICTPPMGSWCCCPCSAGLHIWCREKLNACAQSCWQSWWGRNQVDLLNVCVFTVRISEAVQICSQSLLLSLTSSFFFPSGFLIKHDLWCC
jgi:hypothetical protein